MNPDYKTMSDADLRDILVDIRNTSEHLMDKLTPILEHPNSNQARAQKEQIVAEYALLKNRLKEIYHYIQLGRNDLSGFNFYNAFFCPKIRDCYLSCQAKTNETNLVKLHDSLWNIWDYAYLPLGN